MKKILIVKGLVDDLCDALEERKEVRDRDGYICTGINVKKRLGYTALQNQIVLVRNLLMDISKEIEY